MTTSYDNIKTAPIPGLAEEVREVSTFKRRNFYVSIVIFTASLFYYLSYFNYGFSDSDWGAIVVGAERFLQGDVFYKDFSIGYTPGIYLYTALFFKLFGTSLLSATFSWSILGQLTVF